MVLMEYSWAGGKLIHEKNQKQKISWHCPFKCGGLTIKQIYCKKRSAIFPSSAGISGISAVDGKSLTFFLLCIVTLSLCGKILPLSHRTNRKRTVTFLKERVAVTGTNFYLLTQQNKQYSAFQGGNLVHLEKLL
jgi:hypothetical protein